MWPQIPLVAQSHAGPFVIVMTITVITGVLGVLGTWIVRRLHLDHDEDDPSA